MAYEKQIWNRYDDLKTEEENIENGAVVTDNRMNHIEEGIEAHTTDFKNPHKVTAAQVGLGDVPNYAAATEDEALAGESNETIMTPNLTKAAVKSYVTKEDVGLSNVTNDEQATKEEFNAHTANKSNPHAVTASQVGAYSKQEIDTKLSKTVMADDSGKVTVEGLNINGKISDLGMSNFTPRTITWSSNGINIAFTRVGPLVVGSWGGSQSNVAQGFTYTTLVPSGFRPNAQAKLIVIQSAVSNFNIDTNGTVKYWGVPATNGNLSGMLTYFTNDPFPES